MAQDRRWKDLVVADAFEWTEFNEVCLDWFVILAGHPCEVTHMYKKIQQQRITIKGKNLINGHLIEEYKGWHAIIERIYPKFRKFRLDHERTLHDAAQSRLEEFTIDYDGEVRHIIQPPADIRDTFRQALAYRDSRRNIDHKRWKLFIWVVAIKDHFGKKIYVREAKLRD